MITFLKENWATVLLSVLLLGAVILAVWVLIKDRRKGTCGPCGGCPYAGKCQKKKNDRR